MNRVIKILLKNLFVGVFLVNGLTAYGVSSEDYNQEEDGTSYHGALELNMDVIYDTSQMELDGHRFIGHQLIPDLFLDRTTEVEELIKEQNRMLLDRAYGQSFQSEYAFINYFDSEEIISTLFYNRPIESVPVLRGGITNTHSVFPTWLGVMITTVVIGFSVVIGVGLGRKYASKFRGKD